MGKQRPQEAVPRILLNRQEAANSLGVSLSFFEKNVQPYVRMVVVKSMKLVSPAELQRWADENARAPVR